MTVKVTFTATLDRNANVHGDDETFAADLRTGWNDGEIDVNDILVDSTSLEVEIEVE